MYVPKEFAALFWDIDLAGFDPHQYPDYAIFRVLEHGDTDAVKWLETAFRRDEICRVLRSERKWSIPLTMISLLMMRGVSVSSGMIRVELLMLVGMALGAAE